jgi:DNA-binding NarL/FixJ family response regulator
MSSRGTSDESRGAEKAFHHMHAPACPLSPGLSKRQQEILQAACMGTPDKVIAEQLGVSPRTLESHWRAIHRKLGSLNRFHAGFLFASLREITQVKAVA